MLALVPLLASMVCFCSAEINKKDLNCTLAQSGMSTYSVNATFCTNAVSDETCLGLFGVSKVATYGNEARPVACWSSDEGLTFEPRHKAVAVDYCAKHCGYCCETKAYTTCSNKPNPKLQCSFVTESICKDLNWRATITEECPASCGFCCYDKESNCASVPNICSEYPDYAVQHCRRTCNLCGVDPTTSTTPIPKCVDHEHCQYWIANGFCSQSFYTGSQKKTLCPVGCGFCPGK